METYATSQGQRVRVIDETFSSLYEAECFIKKAQKALNISPLRTLTIEQIKELKKLGLLNNDSSPYLNENLPYNFGKMHV